jgi:hypothetical protein
MRLPRSLLPAVLLIGAAVVEAASSWKFDDASVFVSGKEGVGSGFKDKYVDAESAKAPRTSIY